MANRARLRPYIHSRVWAYGVALAAVILCAGLSRAAGGDSILLGPGETDEVYRSITASLVSAKPELFDQSPQERYPEDLPFPLGNGGAMYPLLDCADPEDFGVSSTDPLFAPVYIAMIAEQLRRNLRKYGIPPRVWDPLVGSIDYQALSYIEDLRRRGSVRGSEPLAREVLDAANVALDDLDRALLEHAGVTNPAAPPPGVNIYSVYSECGEAEISVSVGTNPPGADVALTPLFRYKLCQARRVDPMSPDCGWVAAVKGREFLSGKYRYHARWPDGAVKTGVVDINHMDASRIVLSK